MKKYRVTHEGDGMASNMVVSTIGGMIDAVMRALEFGGTVTVSEVPEELAQKSRSAQRHAKEIKDGWRLR